MHLLVEGSEYKSGLAVLKSAGIKRGGDKYDHTMHEELYRGGQIEALAVIRAGC